MIFFRLIAKILFFPYYIIALSMAIIIWFWNLAFGGSDSLKSIMRIYGIDSYWEL